MGTSYAAPFVSGVASMYLSKFPKATPAQIKDAIKIEYVGPGSPNRMLYSLFDDVGRDTNLFTSSPTAAPTRTLTTAAPTRTHSL
jgi:subtilisin family serine protease